MLCKILKIKTTCLNKKLKIIFLHKFKRVEWIPDQQSSKEVKNTLREKSTIIMERDTQFLCVEGRVLLQICAVW